MRHAGTSASSWLDLDDTVTADPAKIIAVVGAPVPQRCRLCDLNGWRACLLRLPTAVREPFPALAM